MKILKIKKYEQGDIFADVSSSEISPDDLEKLMENILPLWEQLAIFMRPFPGNKESKTMLYIFNLMQIIMPLCSNNLQFDLENFVKDEELSFGGEMDIIIHADTISSSQTEKEGVHQLPPPKRPSLQTGFTRFQSRVRYLY